jgi:hypothetical protein
MDRIYRKRNRAAAGWIDAICERTNSRVSFANQLRRQFAFRCRESVLQGIIICRGFEKFRTSGRMKVPCHGL